MPIRTTRAAARTSSGARVWSALASRAAWSRARRHCWSCLQPSPWAGRVFGVVLVLGYGLGMAGALTAAGLLLVSLRNRLVRLTLGRRVTRDSGLLRLMPVLTALLALVVGALA
jgi:hypothetical protein